MVSKLIDGANLYLTPYAIPYIMKEVKGLSKWEKLVDSILNGDKSLSFDELSRALEKMGYIKHQPHKGSSHYTFRKEGCLPITIPKHKPLNKVYIVMVAEIVKAGLKENSQEEQEARDEDD